MKNTVKLTEPGLMKKHTNAFDFVKDELFTEEPFPVFIWKQT